MRTPPGRVGWLGNRVLNLWGVAAAFTAVASASVPSLERLLGTSPPPAMAWVYLGLFLAAFVAGVVGLVRPWGSFRPGS